MGLLIGCLHQLHQTSLNKPLSSRLEYLAICLDNTSLMNFNLIVSWRSCRTRGIILVSVIFYDCINVFKHRYAVSDAL